jgi:hypothetical protein
MSAMIETASFAARFKPAIAAGTKSGTKFGKDNEEKL